MGKKKVYVKVDKVIEPGDLVRCVRKHEGFNPGDIRKADCFGIDRKTFFYAKGSEEPHWKEFWQPVHKLAIGDQVLWHGEGPYIVDAFPDDLEDYSVHVSHPDDEDDCAYVTEFDLELYQTEKHGKKPDKLKGKWQEVPTIIIGKHDLKPYIGGIGPEYELSRVMVKAEIADMIVELLNRDSSLSAFSSYDKSKATHIMSGDGSYQAICKPQDEWDTLTGLYVALCKATGRKPAKWVYERRRYR